jgi:cysteine desulfurase
VPYLDHAATSPMVQASIDAMDAAFRIVGNASALHSAGREARRIVEESRELIAAAVGCLPG